MPPRSTVLRALPDLRREIGLWRSRGETSALVPTMGALHAGHMALVDLARHHADRVIVSIFVNPAQFAPNEDFAAYPRTFETDRAMLDERNVDAIYAPLVADMYPPGFATTLVVGGPAKAGLEDAVRAHFFAGVATVVGKLLVRCAPDRALFGEKDFQQLLVVRRLATDLDLPTTIIAAPTVREADGLALSSRNRYLSLPDRRITAALPRVMADCVEAVRAGADLPAALARGRVLLEAAGLEIDYFEARDAETLDLPDGSGQPLRLLAAVRIGTTRLIDNMAV